MTIVAARRYLAGKVTDPALDLQRCSLPAVEGEFDWIGVADPTPAELALLQDRYGLHPLAIEDALTRGAPAKAEAFGSMLFVMACTAALQDEEGIAYGQTAIFLDRNFIITVRQGSARAHTALRQQLEANPQRLAQGPDVVLHGLLDYLADGYVPLLDKLDLAVEEMEEGAVAGFPDQARIRRIFRLRRRLRRFESNVGHMEEVAGKLASASLPAIDKKARPYFSDIHDHVRHSLGRARALNDTLGSIVEVASLLEQNRQGAITRQLAAWAAILGVPTAVAGVYGMNFDFMPELHWRHGYFIITGLMLTICLGLYVRFRRIGWL
ncbi:magnesium and cobalt transport protein CorA [Altererythrobacter sp. CC-YST694]|uniref:magnesium and cobalt transport protein CorA n=1 Tax=Altererythrobacter sp. CC-YST694 TaxID=2755038 RepID=UPI001D023B2E|nr:magnesium and cobalt transport protein CorA [Altererythrobacter sp. CC-YST694]MCB5426488.1 magnesium and cobalt transport protein CorA [Altererythrobacter sp. CC-YST694]